jgi:hypothetical protein
MSTRPGAQGLSRQRVYVEPFSGCRGSASAKVRQSDRGFPPCSRDAAGSRDEQAKAKLCRADIDEVAVAFDPPT